MLNGLQFVIVVIRGRPLMLAGVRRLVGDPGRYDLAVDGKIGFMVVYRSR